MVRFVLMHKDIAVSIFDMSGDSIIRWVISKSPKAQAHMPLPLKRIIHYINGGYIEKEDDNSYTINEEGRIFLEIWLSDRAIPANRDNIKQYVKNGNTLAFMLKNHSCSLTDCYWTRQISENIKWSNIKLYNSNQIDRLEVIRNNIEHGETYSGVNATLGGQLEKYWYYSYTKDCSKNNLMLAKRTNINDSILNIREVLASKIYEMQGYKNYCKYYYIRNAHKQIVGCKCRAFTNESLELISAYDLLEEYGHTQRDDVYELIIKYAVNYGADAYQVRYQLDLQTLVDYIITNRDRHQNNIAFLRNPDTLKIESISPIFDSGSSVFMEGRLPLGVTNTKVNGLYDTELKCLEHVAMRRILNFDKLPQLKWVEDELKKMNNANIYNVGDYLQLYKSKISYLKCVLNIRY